MQTQAPPTIEVRDLTMGYGSFVVLEHVSFTVTRGSIFVVMGGSGCGKSTLLRHLIGLAEPMAGAIFYDGVAYTGATPAARAAEARRFGVLFQSSALWSSMTLAENVALPIEQHTDLGPRGAREIAELKLALVGLKGWEDAYPAAVSGGMQKRVGMARAMALDPELLFLDEPSAGLDPVTGSRLDELIVELRDSLGITVVAVTHELASILAIGTDSIFLDGKTRSAIARGSPRELLAHSDDPRVHAFLTRDPGEGAR
jgi:phospholipid/cholesterol/gamma-HCH transport system ATP-binding protein